ncbi:MULTISPECIES: hypothetical protein [Bacteroides]|uniref:hypothetical protein n=1 Tax=Bacteroides TaxID=816 RepID=UPI002585EA2F|nr:hypothetical protein [Bacteroides sp.]
MNISELISAGFIGSVTTLAIKSVIDMLNAHNQYRRELKMQVFKRKTDVVEKAIAWYQEALDTYNMMQITIKGIDTSNQTTWLALQKLIMKCNNLFEESVSRLNPLYLYYDFQEIERKFHATESLSDINDKLVEIQEIGEKISKLDSKNNQIEYEMLQKEEALAFNDYSKLIENQKNIIISIQKQLREEYKKYLC